MNYPFVTGEYETLHLLQEGRSIARFGDGEHKVCVGQDCVSQVKNKDLAREMRAILQAGSNAHCLVGIPPMDNPAIAKQHFWNARLAGRINALLNPEARYHSSFITRPDNAPWIDTREYREKVIDLWRDKDITLVLGSDRSLTSEIMPEARSIHEIWGPRRDAYQAIDRIEQEIIRAGRKTVILCLGCTATVLAWRLKGFHALDLGHIGWMIRDRLS